MKKKKFKLDQNSIPEQIIEVKFEDVEVTEEEEKKKRGIIAWFKKHPKITVTGVAIAACAILFSCQAMNNQASDEDSMLSDDTGIEDIQENSDKDDNIIEDSEENLENNVVIEKKRMYMYRK